MDSVLSFYELIVFKAENDSLITEQAYKFGVDDCYCYIQRLYGPERIVLVKKDER